jgi:hypothetical protein
MNLIVLHVAQEGNLRNFPIDPADLRAIPRGTTLAVTMREGDELDAAGVVPGFTCGVGDIFDV